MSQMKASAELADAPRKLVPLRVSHHRGGPVLPSGSDCLRAPEPGDEAPRRPQSEPLFGQRWGNRPPVPLNMFAAGEEHAL
jgi:hypothetical protein